MTGISAILDEAGLPAQIISVPLLFDIVYAAGDIADYLGWLRADVEMQKRLHAVPRGRHPEGRERRGAVGSKEFQQLMHTDAHRFKSVPNASSVCAGSCAASVDPFAGSGPCSLRTDEIDEGA
jgi:hypothetical protein